MQESQLITARQFQQRAGGLSWEQLQQALNWGLIERREGNRFDVTDVPPIRKLYEMGAEVRSFPRRILRYRAEPYVDLPVPTLRRAICELLPAILTPGQKMKRVHIVRTWVDESLRGEGLAKWDVHGKLPRDRWPAPPRKAWKLALEGVPESFFGTRLGIVYYHTTGLIPWYQQYGHYDITDIPLEEQVTLLMIAEMASWQERRQQALHAQ